MGCSLPFWLINHKSALFKRLCASPVIIGLTACYSFALYRRKTVTALKQTPPILDPHYRLPRVLNHYTSIASLLAILNSGHIWATHCQYLNDESEIKNFRNFLGQLLRLANEQSADFKRRHAPLLSSLLNEVQNDTNVYIASFSSIGDDLTQWRAYCPSGAGVSIGFDSRALEVEYISGTSKDDFIEVNAFLEKVRYMSAGWAKGFFRNLDRMGENSDQAADPLRGLIGVSKREAHARLLSAWLATAAPLYKDASFRTRVAYCPNRPPPCPTAHAIPAGKIHTDSLCRSSAKSWNCWQITGALYHAPRHRWTHPQYEYRPCSNSLTVRQHRPSRSKGGTVADSLPTLVRWWALVE
jgi:hypothetical protein